VKRQATKDAAGSKVSRAAIADRLSRSLGRRITTAVLDAVLSETKPNRFSADWIPAWVQITGSTKLLAMLCEGAGYYLADETTLNLAALARAELGKKKLAQEAADLTAKLRGKV
jgi:hypothetical protein